MGTLRAGPELPAVIFLRGKDAEARLYKAVMVQPVFVRPAQAGGRLLGAPPDSGPGASPRAQPHTEPCPALGAPPFPSRPRRAPPASPSGALPVPGLGRGPLGGGGGVRGGKARGRPHAP